MSLLRVETGKEAIRMGHQGRKVFSAKPKSLTTPSSLEPAGREEEGLPFVH